MEGMIVRQAEHFVLLLLYLLWASSRLWPGVPPVWIDLFPILD